MIETVHPEIPRKTFEALVGRSRTALKTLRNEGSVPMKGRNIVGALALIIADDLVREVGVERPLAAQAAAEIEGAGEYWPDITQGGRALLAQRLGMPAPEEVPAPVLLAIVHEAAEPKPMVWIGPLEVIQRHLAKGDHFVAVSATKAWATLVERAAQAQLDLNPHIASVLGRKQ